MKKPLENFAFIDSQNLNLGIRDQGWDLDFRRFRIYLNEKYTKAVIVTGDGDFYCLVKYLTEQGKLLKLMIPNRHKYSMLLNKTGISIYDIVFMNQFRHLLEYKKQHPR